MIKRWKRFKKKYACIDFDQFEWICAIFAIFFLIGYLLQCCLGNCIILNYFVNYFIYLRMVYIRKKNNIPRKVSNKTIK